MGQPEPDVRGPSAEVAVRADVVAGPTPDAHLAALRVALRRAGRNESDADGLDADARQALLSTLAEHHERDALRRLACDDNVLSIRAEASQLSGPDVGAGRTSIQDPTPLSWDVDWDDSAPAHVRPPRPGASMQRGRGWAEHPSEREETDASEPDEPPPADYLATHSALTEERIGGWVSLLDGTDTPDPGWLDRMASEPDAAVRGTVYARAARTALSTHMFARMATHPDEAEELGRALASARFGITPKQVRRASTQGVRAQLLSPLADMSEVERIRWYLSLIPFGSRDRSESPDEQFAWSAIEKVQPSMLRVVLRRRWRWTRRLRRSAMRFRINRRAPLDQSGRVSDPTARARRLFSAADGTKIPEPQWFVLEHDHPDPAQVGTPEVDPYRLESLMDWAVRGTRVISRRWEDLKPAIPMAKHGGLYRFQRGLELIAPVLLIQALEGHAGEARIVVHRLCRIDEFPILGAPSEVRKRLHEHLTRACEQLGLNHDVIAQLMPHQRVGKRRRR